MVSSLNSFRTFSWSTELTHSLSRLIWFFKSKYNWSCQRRVRLVELWKINAPSCHRLRLTFSRRSANISWSLDCLMEYISLIRLSLSCLIWFSISVSDWYFRFSCWSSTSNESILWEDQYRIKSSEKVSKSGGEDDLNHITRTFSPQKLSLFRRDFRSEFLNFFRIHSISAAG